jgi:putative phosphoesterase
MSRAGGRHRVAVIADIHGNAAALDAVLAELAADRPDAIVVGGDVATGPEPAEVLERLMGLENARFVQGNSDRELVDAYDAGSAFDPDDPDPARKSAAWCAPRITRAQRDFLAGFERRAVLTVAGLGEVLFCHGSPRSDLEIMTSLTPEETMRRLLARVGERVVVCGHTHVQFDRTVGGTRIVNAGSVGMAYEGARGAFWLRLGPDVDLRRTEYDVQPVAERFLASDYWDADGLAREILLAPPDPLEVERFFEQVAADRGERT